MTDTDRKPDSTTPPRTPSPKNQDIERGHEPKTLRYQELERTPGIEVIAISTLEVVPPRPPLLFSQPSSTWDAKPIIFDYGASPLTPYSATTQGFSGYPYEQKEPAPLTRSHPGPRKRIAGLKRQTFFILLAIGIFIAVVGIASGVGVGIALGKNNKQSGTSTSSRLFPLPTAQAVIAPGRSITCPANNLTLYTSPADKSKHFTLLCGRDYNSAQGTIDLYSQEAATMAECIDMCAGQAGCVGAGWGWWQTSNVCWLKSFLATAQPSALWYFAALDNATGLDLPEARSKRGVLL